MRFESPGPRLTAGALVAFVTTRNNFDVALETSKRLASSRIVDVRT